MAFSRWSFRRQIVDCVISSQFPSDLLWGFCYYIWNAVHNPQLYHAVSSFFQQQAVHKKSPDADKRQFSIKSLKELNMLKHQYT